MAASEPLLSVRDVHTYYGDSYVLHGLSLELQRGRDRLHPRPQRHGQDHADPHHRGSDAAAPGRGDLRGPRVSERTALRDRTGGVAIVPQGRRIFKSLSVRENLALPTSSLAGRGRVQQVAGRKHWTMGEVLTEFPQLQERLSSMGGSLSGGEQQMLAIGRALMANPTLILMDEPSEGLAPKLVQRVEEIVRSLRASGLAILLVEQNLELALSVADSIYVISSGSFVFHGTPGELSARKDILDSHLGVAAHA